MPACAKFITPKECYSCRHQPAVARSRLLLRQSLKSLNSTGKTIVFGRGGGGEVAVAIAIEMQRQHSCGVGSGGSADYCGGFGSGSSGGSSTSSSGSGSGRTAAVGAA